LLPLPASPQTGEEEQTEILRPPPVQPPQANTPALAEVTNFIISKTNAFREEHGRPAVKVNAKLTRAAHYFADYMARTSRFGHTADGERPSGRAKKFGYHYCLIAENIAYEYNSEGFATENLATQFFEGWKHSPGHRKNMRDPDVTDTGVAVARGEDTGYYFAVQMFGRPKSKDITFEVSNQTDATIRYTVGGRTFVLPPHYLRTHQRCRPADLTFPVPSKGVASQTVRPHKGDHYLIVQQQGKLTLKEEK
jgi:uncharacterized protein YkwD